MCQDNVHCGCHSPDVVWMYPYHTPAQAYAPSRDAQFQNNAPSYFAVMQIQAPGAIAIEHQNAYFQSGYHSGWTSPGTHTQQSYDGYLPATDEQYNLPLKTGYKGSCM